MGGCTSTQIKVPNEKRFRRAIKLYEVSDVRVLTNLFNRDKCFDTGETPLTLAAQEGHEAIVHSLVSNGADVNKFDRNGCGPLHIAVSLNDEETSDILLSANANPNKYDGSNNLTPLHIAAEKGHTNLAKKLLAAGASPNEHRRALPPLVFAVNNGHAECVDVLLKHGADPNSLDARGDTLLHNAVAKSEVLITKLLLEYKADVNIPCHNDDTLTSLAALTGCPGTLKLLLDTKCKIDEHKDEEPPAIVAAVAIWNVECVDLLVEAGYDVNVTDKRGHTPLQIAAFSIIETERESFYSKYFSNVYRHYSKFDIGAVSPENAVKCVMSLVQGGADLDKIWDKFINLFPGANGISFEQMVLCEVLVQSYGFQALPKKKLRKFVASLFAMKEYSLIKLVYSAGVNPSWEEESSIAISTEDGDREMYTWIKRLRTTPRTLKDLCRQKTRRLLSSNVLYNVLYRTPQLPILPAEVKEYVCIMDTDHYSAVQ